MNQHTSAIIAFAKRRLDEIHQRPIRLTRRGLDQSDWLPGILDAQVRVVDCRNDVICIGFAGLYNVQLYATMKGDEVETCWMDRNVADIHRGATMSRRRLTLKLPSLTAARALRRNKAA